MRTAPVALIVVCLGCGDNPKPVKTDALILDSASAAEFADHPERFSGKTIQATLYLSDNTARLPNQARAGLRDLAGKEAMMVSCGYSPVQFKIRLRLPEDVPNAGWLDEVVVVFKCSGSLESGNEAVSVKRP